MQKDLEKMAPEGYRFLLDHDFQGRLRSAGEGNGPGYRLIMIKPPGSPQRDAVYMEPHENEALFEKIGKRIVYWTEIYHLAETGDRRRARFVAQLTRLMYFTRNYFFDGMLPILLGLISLAAILGIIQLDWIPTLFPSFKTLHH
jgi:hypothetical protein